MLIAVGSVKGAPGATTLALGLTGVWPGPALLVEADPSGGDLACRFGHHPDPGLASLAATARPGAAGRPMGLHAQRLRLGIDVVLAWPGDAAAAPVRALAESGTQLLVEAARVGTVVVDVGRLAPGSPGLAIVGTADHVLLVVGASLEQQTHLQTRLGWLRAAVPGRLWLVLAGGGRYRGGEVARDLGIAVLGEVPDSRWGAGVLSGRLASPSWRRLRLPRALHGIALTLGGLGCRPRALAALPNAPAAWRAGLGPQGVAGPTYGTVGTVPTLLPAPPSAPQAGLPYRVLGGGQQP
jgi:hypothetical protein